jgi:hypothetical protein
MTRTFRASPAAYAIPCGVVLGFVGLVAYRSVRDHTPQIGLISGVLACGALFALGARTLKLTFDRSTLTYRRLFMRTRRVQYSDILAARSVNKFIGGTGPHIGVELKLRGSPNLTILCKAFPREAYVALLSLDPSGSNQRLERP